MLLLLLLSLITCCQSVPRARDVLPKPFSRASNGAFDVPERIERERERETFLVSEKAAAAATAAPIIFRFDDNDFCPRLLRAV